MDSFKQELKPFIKWPGGKSAELDIIHQNLPQKINDYLEPFLGGGACFLSCNPVLYKQAYLNDLAQELIMIYWYLQARNESFFKYLEMLSSFWNYSGVLADESFKTLDRLYTIYNEQNIHKNELKILVSSFIEDTQADLQIFYPRELIFKLEDLLFCLQRSVFSKLLSIKRNELQRGPLTAKDYHCNLEAGIRAGFYTFFRYLYNNRQRLGLDQELHIALFYFLREFCYSSMFRYNRQGEFNVPYGGLSYNRKNFQAKIDYMCSGVLREILEPAQFSAVDFRIFLKNKQLQKDDFIFVDPPYDTKFSTYANQKFLLQDQRKLADFLIKYCPARFMLIIKNTDFIYNLYKSSGVRIIGFDKKYQVSFMERNEKGAEHLLIMNY